MKLFTKPSDRFLEQRKPDPGQLKRRWVELFTHILKVFISRVGQAFLAQSRQIEKHEIELHLCALRRYLFS